MNAMVRATSAGPALGGSQDEPAKYQSDVPEECEAALITFF
jgi:hypothetical protein